MAIMTYIAFAITSLTLKLDSKHYAGEQKKVLIQKVKLLKVLMHKCLKFAPLNWPSQTEKPLKRISDIYVQKRTNYLSLGYDWKKIE